MQDANWSLTITIPNGNDLSFTGSGNDTINATIPANTELINRDLTFAVRGVGATTIASGVARDIIRTQLAAARSGGGRGGTTPGNQDI